MGSCVSGGSKKQPQDNFIYVDKGFEYDATCSHLGFCIHAVRIKGCHDIMSRHEVISYCVDNNIKIPSHFQGSSVRLM